MPEKPLTDEEVKMCKELFAAIDADGDGKISHADFKTALEKAGLQNVKDSEVKKYLAMADKDNSGAVTWDEFFKVCKTRPIKKRVMKNLFQELDTDNSGSIDAKDVKTVIKKAGLEGYSDDEVDKLIKTADKNGDGKVNYEEFEAAMNKLLE